MAKCQKEMKVFWIKLRNGIGMNKKTFPAGWFDAEGIHVPSLLMEESSRAAATSSWGMWTWFLQVSDLVLTVKIKKVTCA